MANIHQIIINKTYDTVAALNLNFNGLPQGDPNNILNNAIRMVLIFAGIVCVIVLIFAGVMYMTANGESGKIQTAKRTIIGAIAGLIVTVLAFAITSFVLGAF